MQEFGVSNLVATVGLSLYIIGLALGPMFLGPLSYVFPHNIWTSFTHLHLFLVNFMDAVQFTWHRLRSS